MSTAAVSGTVMTDDFLMAVTSASQGQWLSQILGRLLYLLHPVETRFRVQWEGEQQLTHDNRNVTPQ